MNRYKYTTKEAQELDKRNRTYNTLYMVGLQETSDIFWDAWQAEHQPIGPIKQCIGLIKRKLGL